MPAPASSYYPSSSPMPINAPAKSYYAQPQYQYARHPAYSRLSTSPPEVAESVTSGAPSYEPSATSGSYADHGSDYDSQSTGSGVNVDLLEYMSERLSGAFDPLPLDRGLAKQAQASGELNAKTRELLALQLLAKRRLAATRANMAEGLQAAKETQRDLQWTQQRVAALHARAAQKYPKQYKAASKRVPRLDD